MKTIWKYPVHLGIARMELPKGARILTTQMQDSEAVMWALVDTEQPTETRWIFAAMTGRELPADASAWTFIGTIQAGFLVFHIFECTAPED